MPTKVVSLDSRHRLRAAELLVEGFREHWPEAWPTLEDAREEFDEVLELGPARGVVDENGTLVGWIGARVHYDGNVWEIHPIVVAEEARGSGIGRRLIADIERLASDAGVLAIQVGSDDEDGMTSLGGVDLYPDPLRHLQTIEDRKGHPFGFYIKCGFSVVGVMPDANGFGRPDIFLAKRVSAPTAPVASPRAR
jgi:aminoglycoside 6'-N-acetyltransferase I